eukprot:6251018-Prymnesium_polylepis.1
MCCSRMTVTWVARQSRDLTRVWAVPWGAHEARTCSSVIRRSSSARSRTSFTALASSASCRSLACALHTHTGGGARTKGRDRCRGMFGAPLGIPARLDPSTPG